MVYRNDGSYTKSQCIWLFAQFIVPIFCFIFLVVIILSRKAFAANPRTPSQALPKMFQKPPPSAGYYEMKKQECNNTNSIPEIPIEQQEDTGITITPQTLIILAPTELCKI